MAVSDEGVKEISLGVAKRENNVVFPHPLGPITAILSCSFIVKVAFSNSVLREWVQVMFLTESSDMGRYYSITHRSPLHFSLGIIF